MSRITLGLLGVLVAVTAIVYAPTLRAGFVYEDGVYTDAAQQPTNRVIPVAPRALTEWSFRANYLLGGLNPAGYHAVNVALHLLVGVLVGIVAWRMGWSELAALCASAVFLLHPLNSQAVSYVAGRADLLAAVGVLVTLLVATSGRFTVTRGVVLLVAIGLACGGKEMGLTVVLLVLAYWRWVRPQWAPSKDLLLVGGTIALFVVAPMVYERLIAGNEYAFASERNGLGYMAVQSAAVWKYLGLVAWPSGLSIDHDFDLVSPALAFTALAGLIVTLIAAHRWGSRLVRFAAWSVVLVLVPRFFVRIPEYLNEHQFYLSMIGVAWLVGHALSRVVEGRRVAGV